MPDCIEFEDGTALYFCEACDERLQGVELCHIWITEKFCQELHLCEQCRLEAEGDDDACESTLKHLSPN